MVSVGIDIGGSTTKIVGFDAERNLMAPILIKATDPITSIYGALGRFTFENGLALSDIKELMVTGVGSSYVEDSLYDRPCSHLNEFECIGRGGLYLSGLDRAIIVSMGTGTALVYADKDGKCDYLGGTGVGGGTLMGLSRQMLGTDDIRSITKLAAEGDINKVDLKITDITADDDDGLSLPDSMTAANFGKVSDMAEKADIALGIINMIFETIGMMAIFAARSHGIKDVVLTGSLSTIPQAKHCFDVFNRMFGMNFIIPDNSQFSTVIGAAMN
ncbi:MAG: type II pantothenate kinase [Ruminococcaceae bacterium]|nr:type II pantothenate kinase [Oscillospiraceae bacterium]